MRAFCAFRNQEKVPFYGLGLVETLLLTYWVHAPYCYIQYLRLLQCSSLSHCLLQANIGHETINRKIYDFISLFEI